MPTNPLVFKDAFKACQTVGEAVNAIAAAFEEAGLIYGHGTDNPWDDAVYLVLGALDLPLDSDESIASRPLTPVEKEQLFTLAQKRMVDRIPTAYLLGDIPFAGLSFEVNEHVLIPRSPIAELIELGFAPWVEPTEIKRILDVGTGSGCIAIASAVHVPQAHVDAMDISAEALQVAKRNAARHGVAERVTCVEKDLLEGLPDHRYDVIVSNPPYVSTAETQALPAEFQHEPLNTALDAGPKGLDHVTALLKYAKQHLTEEGILIVEVGATAEDLEKAFPSLPFAWLEFERGGDGVFLLNASSLD